MSRYQNATNFATVASITVGPSGTAQYTTIAEAIAAIPSGTSATNQCNILIKPLLSGSFYSESLTLTDGINLIGLAPKAPEWGISISEIQPAAVVIRGTMTCSGKSTFANIEFRVSGSSVNFSLNNAASYISLSACKVLCHNNAAFNSIFASTVVLNSCSILADSTSTTEALYQFGALSNIVIKDSFVNTPGGGCNGIVNLWMVNSTCDFWTFCNGPANCYYYVSSSDWESDTTAPLIAADVAIDMTLVVKDSNMICGNPQVVTNGSSVNIGNPTSTYQLISSHFSGTVGIDLTVIPEIEGCTFGNGITTPASYPYFASYSDYGKNILVDSTAATRSVKLPQLAPTGWRTKVTDIAGLAPTNNITVSSSGSTTIKLSSSFVMNDYFQSAGFQKSGSINYAVI